MARRVAIVLFNLGGPDKPEAIRPFLLNLFTDPAILRVPFFVRPILARLIAQRRLEAATANYDLLGGRSPLLGLTQAQAAALEARLTEFEAKCFIAMRYWHPLSDETAQAVREWQPDEVVLLPLYPHYSTTTTGSSLTAWREVAARIGLVADTTTICCYAIDADYIAATTKLLRTAYDTARARLDPGVRLRVLFSAHGLPEAVVRAGDPYQWQIEQTVSHVLARWDARELGNAREPDWAVCYQSRATPQQWLRPSTEVEIERAAHDGVALLVMPIAFVSEHSETLVELDVEYRMLAERLGVPGYFRVPAQNSDVAFIAALAGLVQRARSHGPGLCSHGGIRICPTDRRDCPQRVWQGI
jgi:protoporphyrin/coproporphyrin ferrochelatase